MKINKLDSCGPETLAQKFTRPLRGFLGGRDITPIDGTSDFQSKKIYGVFARIIAAFVLAIGFIYTIPALIVLLASSKASLPITPYKREEEKPGIQAVSTEQLQSFGVSDDITKDFFSGNTNGNPLRRWADNGLTSLNDRGAIDDALQFLRSDELPKPATGQSLDAQFGSLPSVELLMGDDVVTLLPPDRKATPDQLARGIKMELANQDFDAATVAKLIVRHAKEAAYKHSVVCPLWIDITKELAKKELAIIQETLTKGNTPEKRQEQKDKWVQFEKAAEVILQEINYQQPGRPLASEDLPIWEKACDLWKNISISTLNLDHLCKEYMSFTNYKEITENGFKQWNKGMRESDTGREVEQKAIQENNEKAAALKVKSDSVENALKEIVAA